MTATAAAQHLASSLIPPLPASELHLVSALVWVPHLEGGKEPGVHLEKWATIGRGCVARLAEAQLQDGP